MGTFELAISVAPGDIDELGHVNNVTYIRWVQEAAVGHWRTLASAKDHAELVWIVVRHEIDYLRPAYAGEQIVARTWVGSATRLKFDRHTEIVRGEVVLARARTVWCPLSAATGKPTAVSTEVRQRFSVPEST